MTPVYFLSLLAVVYGGLIIDIDVKTDPPFIDVRNSSELSTNVISDVERELFGIQDPQLKKAVASYTADNTEPDFVYVKKTGEEHDLYTDYAKFQEIKTIVKPKYVDAVIITDCDLKPGMTPRITTDWKINGNLKVADNIAHIIYLETGEKMEVSAWGQGINESITVSGDHVKLCSMTVKIEYEMTIAGHVAADYTKSRKSTDGDHHYYAYDVFNVQEAAGLPKSVIAGSETITVIYPKKKETPSSNTTSKTSSTV